MSLVPQFPCLFPLDSKLKFRVNVVEWVVFVLKFAIWDVIEQNKVICEYVRLSTLMNRRPIANIYIFINKIVRFYSRIRKIGLAPIHMAPTVGKDQVTVRKTESKLFWLQ